MSQQIGKKPSSSWTEQRMPISLLPQQTPPRPCFPSPKPSAHTTICNKANKAKAFIITESVFLPYEKKFHDLYDYLQEFNVVIFTTQDNSIYDFLADTIRDYFEGCTVLGNIYSVTEEYYANVTEYEEAINALDSATFRILNGEYTHKSWDS